MKWVMVVLDGHFSNGHQVEEEKTYVASYDLDYGRGMGKVETTTDPTQAMWWPYSLDVFKAWKQVSPKYPIRADGKPNRPLSALTITVDTLDE